jgi:hypothetical protein
VAEPRALPAVGDPPPLPLGHRSGHLLVRAGRPQQRDRLVVALPRLSAEPAAEDVAEDPRVGGDLPEFDQPVGERGVGQGEPGHGAGGFGDGQPQPGVQFGTSHHVIVQAF